MKDLVVVLPGIMGSVLERAGTNIWHPGPGMLGAFLRGQSWIDRLALPDNDPIDTTLASDGVKPVALVSTQSIVPGMTLIDGYSELPKALLRAFGDDLVEGHPDEPGTRADGRRAALGPPNFYRFPYDWRRDIRASAVRLDELIRPALAQWRRRSPQARIILIAHSMGGLVARYWLEGIDPRTGEDFDGWRDVTELLTFGTPHRGSLDTVEKLVHGLKVPLLGNFASALRTFPSVHQLLPRYRCILDQRSTGDGQWHYPKDLGLEGISTPWARSAYEDFHRCIELGVSRHNEHAGYPRDHLVPILGFGHDTCNSMVLTDTELTTSTEVPAYLDAEFADGDGTVPLVSSIPLELDDRRTQVRYLNQRHGSLQSDSRAVQAEIVKRIAQTQKSTRLAADGGASDHRDRPQISVTHPPIWSHDDPSANIRLSRLVGADQCNVVVRELSGTHTADQIMMIDDEWKPDLPQGEYCVEVTQGSLHTKSGFVVLDHKDA